MSAVAISHHGPESLALLLFAGVCGLPMKHPQHQQHQQHDDLPRTGYVREPTVLRHIPWGRSTLWSKAKKGEFPKPVKLSKRITAWRAEDIWAWIEAQGRPT